MIKSSSIWKISGVPSNASLMYLQKMQTYQRIIKKFVNIMIYMYTSNKHCSLNSSAA